MEAFAPEESGGGGGGAVRGYKAARGKGPFRFHVLQPPFMLANAENSICAFTQKARKFAKMMTRRGQTVYYYGHEDSEVECTELVPVLTKKDFCDIYKVADAPDFKDPSFVAGNHDRLTTLYNMRSLVRIVKVCEPWDFLCCFWGVSAKPISDELQRNYKMLVVEPGIGNNYFFAPHSAFESYAVMHYNYGMQKINPRPYDAVVPNYFDVDEFEFNPDKSKCKYFLYLGRIIAIKGIDIIVTIAKRMPEYDFVFAGPNTLAQNGYTGLENYKNIKEIGSVNVEQRKGLLAHAIALFLPTLYAEPFGGTTVEAMMSGTPVIASDWGVFAETVPHGVVGYRCRTLEQYEWATKNVAVNIDRDTCRRWALHYSLDGIFPVFMEWFDTIRRHYISPYNDDDDDNKKQKCEEGETKAEDEDEEKKKEEEEEEEEEEEKTKGDGDEDDDEDGEDDRKEKEKEKSGKDVVVVKEKIPRVGFYAQHPSRTELDWLYKRIAVIGGGSAKTQKRRNARKKDDEA